MAGGGKIDRRKVLSRVRQAEANGLSATRIGYLACGDPMFVPKLKRGHTFRQMTLVRAYDAICAFDTPRMVKVTRGAPYKPKVLT